MRPHRARLAYTLVQGYGLDNQMKVFRPQPRSFEQLTEFHADEYVNFLQQVRQILANR
jgi:histone deacetylase 1/2